MNKQSLSTTVQMVGAIFVQQKDQNKEAVFQDNTLSLYGGADTYTGSMRKKED